MNTPQVSHENYIADESQQYDGGNYDDENDENEYDIDVDFCDDVLTQNSEGIWVPRENDVEYVEYAEYAEDAEEDADWMLSHAPHVKHSRANQYGVNNTRNNTRPDGSKLAPTPPVYVTDYDAMVLHEWYEIVVPPQYNQGRANPGATATSTLLHSLFLGRVVNKTQPSLETCTAPAFTAPTPTPPTPGDATHKGIAVMIYMPGKPPHLDILYDDDIARDQIYITHVAHPSP